MLKPLLSMTKSPPSGARTSFLAGVAPKKTTATIKSLIANKDKQIVLILALVQRALGW